MKQIVRVLFSKIIIDLVNQIKYFSSSQFHCFNKNVNLPRDFLYVLPLLRTEVRGQSGEKGSHPEDGGVGELILRVETDHPGENQLELSSSVLVLRQGGPTPEHIEHCGKRGDGNYSTIKANFKLKLRYFVFTSYHS